jgi:hypothetical protein
LKTKDATENTVAESSSSASTTSTTIIGPLMLCQHGLRSEVNGTYIDGVREFRPPTYMNVLPDWQLFDMANTCCTQWSIPDGSGKVRSFVMEAYGLDKYEMVSGPIFAIVSHPGATCSMTVAN